MTTTSPSSPSSPSSRSGETTHRTHADEPPLRPRSTAELLLAQLHAIDRCATATILRRQSDLSREERMDQERLRAARERERAAMVTWTAHCLADSVLPLEEPTPPRAVVAHRQPWFRDKVAEGLERQGVRVVAVVEDGADASGTVLAEQPEILLLEDRLTSFSGLDVVRRAHAFAPGTFVGVQVTDATDIGELLSAGAGSVFTRQVPPADVVVELTRCLVEQLGP